jgi:endonuclease YncB( thermonuclease family)
VPIGDAPPRIEVACSMLRKLIGLHLVLSAGFVLAADLSGIVTEVHDGDSITLANSQHTYRIRLLDIDAPELEQPRGLDSRTSLRDLCLLKAATVETQGEDRYGRTLARIQCAGVDANVEQVRRGWAWVFRRYVPKDSSLFEVEYAARLDRRGLWGDDDVVPPWEWRARRQSGESR